MIRQNILMLFFALGMAISFAETKAAGLVEIKKRGVLHVALDPGFLPFEMQTPKNEWVGFDIELMQAFAKSIGVKAEFIGTKWEGIIPGLMAGKYDIIASGMTITEERKRAVLFSKPYYEAGLKVMVAKKNQAIIKNWAELDQEQFTVFVKLGTTGDIYATKHLKKAKIRRMDTEADAAQAVALGRADAFVYDKPYLEIYASSQAGKIVLLNDVLTSESFGLAARKVDRDLIDAVDAFLVQWRASGGYQAAYKAMFEDLSWKKHFPQKF